VLGTSRAWHVPTSLTHLGAARSQVFIDDAHSAPHKEKPGVVHRQILVDEAEVTREAHPLCGGEQLARLGALASHRAVGRRVLREEEAEGGLVMP